MFDWLDFIIKPIEWVVSYIFYGIHTGLSVVFGSGAGAAWVISIPILTIFVRICILPIFLKSLKNTRKMQAIMPEIKAVQKKYKGKTDQASKQALAQETMKLYQENGANPIGGCLPLLIQSPFFFALWRLFSSVKDVAEGTKEPVGPISKEIASDIESSSLFGVNLSETFNSASGNTSHIAVIVVMIAIMCTGMFVSQRLIVMKNMPIAAKEGPQFAMQKNMIYIFPLMYIFSGIMFPVGVLLYMVTTNIFTLCQNLWQLEFMPTPGSEAAEAKEEKQKMKEEQAKEALKISDLAKYEELYGVPDERKKQRKQPTRRKGKK